jgi:uncharacterized membrane protein
MILRKSEIIILVIILISFAIGIYLYPGMPGKMASHWNYKGEVDGYMPKFWGLFLMPFLSLGLLFLFILIPRIDPLKENIEKFRKYFDRFIILIIIFLFYLYLLTILWSLGRKFDMIQVLVPAFGVIFYYAGVLTENAKKNWFIGIRTPWTLSNEKTWDKTHEVGGKLFKAAAIVSFLGIFFSKYAIFFVIIPAIGVSIYTVIYSYFIYQKEKNN